MLQANDAFPLECQWKIWLSDNEQLSKLRLVQFEKADNLPLIWDSMANQNPLVSRNHLSALENANADLAAFYFILYEGDKPLTCFYFQLITLSRNNYDKFSEKKWLNELFGLYINHRKYGLLICGSIFHSHFQGIFSNQNVSNELILRALCRSIDRIRSKKKVSAILLKDTPLWIQTILQKDSAGFTKLPDDISMEMEIPNSWITFEDYYQSLTAKYATRVRKVRQNLDTVVRKELSLQEIQIYQKQIHNYYLQILQKQSIRIGIIPENYFYAIKQRLPENFWVFGYFHKEDLVAFSTGYSFEQTIEVHYIGFDSVRNNELSLYFNILLDGVSDAILQKKKKLILGRTALEAKAILGCKPKILYNYLRTHSSLLSWSVELFYEWFQQGQNENWKNRNPFKRT